MEQENEKPWTSWDNPVLTPEQWQEVRRACEAGMSYGEASQKWNVENATIRKRAQREEWITDSRIKVMAEKIIEKESQEKAKAIESRLVTKGGLVQNAPSSAISAVVETFESHRSQTLLGLAKLAGKGIQRAIDANLEIENWQDAKIAADIAMKLHNVGQDSVQVNIAQAFAGMDEGPLVSISGDLDEGETVEATYFVDDE